MLCYYLPTFIRINIIKFVLNFYCQNEKMRSEDNSKRDVNKLNKFVRLSLPIFFCGKLKKIKFYDMIVSVPVKSEELLLMRYGEDWKIPKKVFKAYTV